MFVLRSQITQCLPPLFPLAAVDLGVEADLAARCVLAECPAELAPSTVEHREWGFSAALGPFKKRGRLPGGKRGLLQASSPVSVCVWQWPLGGPGSQTCSRGRSRADLVFAQRQTTEICILTQSKKEEREKKEGRRLRVCRPCGSPRVVGSPQAQLECQCVSPPGLA